LDSKLGNLENEFKDFQALLAKHPESSPAKDMQPKSNGDTDRISAPENENYVQI